ncbi:hypothetical protein D3C80_1967220 [compost metagenome]
MLEQKRRLFDLLDALGLHLQAHALCQGDDDPHNGCVVLVPRQSGDKTLVDLEFLYRQALEPQQRRITGAEIIDGQPHTQLP